MGKFKIFRTSLLALLTVTVAPAVGEFFVKLAEQNGAYDDPNARVSSLLSVITQSAFYWSAVLFIMGLVWALTRTGCLGGGTGHL